MMSKCHPQLLSFLVAALVGILYLGLVLTILPQRFFYSGDGGLKLLQVRNLVEKWHWDLDIEYPGEPLDPHHQFVPLGRTGFYFQQNG
ncbi:MAG TPA: hypothetical protein EYH31_01205, partial [Anaerolineae bacterium]|nr:hypothetical protein [Anaerolineae bacterium]